MADALVADAIPHNQVLRPMHSHPAVVRIDNRRPLHLAAAHRVADQMKVNRISPQHVFFAQMREAGVADAAAAVAVIKRVAADTFGVGRFDGDVAREVRDFATEIAAAEVLVRERLVERERAAVDLFDDPFFGLHLLRFIFPAERPAASLMHRPGDDHLVADLPAADVLRERDVGVVRFGIRAELHPRAVQRRAVNFHSRATANNRRGVVLIHAVDVMQANAGRVFSRDRLFRRADEQLRAIDGKQILARLSELVHAAKVAGESALAANAAVLHFD